MLVKLLVTQSCPILCDPMKCSPPGPSVCEILQAGIREWVAISSSRGSSDPVIEPGSPALLADSLPPGKVKKVKNFPTREAQEALCLQIRRLRWFRCSQQNAGRTGMLLELISA